MTVDPVSAPAVSPRAVRLFTGSRSLAPFPPAPPHPRAAELRAWFVAVVAVADDHDVGDAPGPDEWAADAARAAGKVLLHHIARKGPDIGWVVDARGQRVERWTHATPPPRSSPAPHRWASWLKSRNNAMALRAAQFRADGHDVLAHAALDPASPTGGTADTIARCRAYGVVVDVRS